MDRAMTFENFGTGVRPPLSTSDKFAAKHCRMGWFALMDRRQWHWRFSRAAAISLWHGQTKRKCGRRFNPPLGPICAPSCLMDLVSQKRVFEKPPNEYARNKDPPRLRQRG